MLLETAQTGIEGLAEGVGTLRGGFEGDGTKNNPGANNLAAGTVQAIGATSTAIDNLAALIKDMAGNQGTVQAQASLFSSVTIPALIIWFTAVSTAWSFPFIVA